MADSKKEEGREDDDHPFDYTDSKKEEAGHDDVDHPFADSKKEEAGHDDDEVNEDEEDDGDEEDDAEPFDYDLQLVAQAALDVWKEDFPESYPGDGKERSPPLQSPQDCSHVVTKKKRRSSPKKCSKTTRRRVSPPASSSNSDEKPPKSSLSSSRGKAKMQETASANHTTDSDDDGSDDLVPDDYPNWNTDVATDAWFEEKSEAAPTRAIPKLSRSKSRRANSNSGEGSSIDQRLQSHLAAGADRATDHQPPPLPAAPQAGRTWREVHREMGGDEVVQIGKKTVHMSDKDVHQSRLLLPQGLEEQVYEHVCPSERKKINSADGLQVDVLDDNGERFQMTCKYRACQKGLVFNGGWTHFLRKHAENHLKEGKSLLILAFRWQLLRLCFVFVTQDLVDLDRQQPADDQHQVNPHLMLLHAQKPS